MDARVDDRVPGPICQARYCYPSLSGHAVTLDNSMVNPASFENPLMDDHQDWRRSTFGR